MKITNPIPGVLLVKEDTQYEIASLFMRLQEFYESPMEEIKNSYFTIEQFMDAYAKKYGNFTYTEDWTGFNVPGDKVDEFFRVFSPDLTIKEARLFGRLKLTLDRFTQKGEKFYLVGIYRLKDAAHEIAHALWYLDPYYRSDMKKVISNVSYSLYSQLTSLLLKWGYCDDVVEDEVQAYLATSDEKFWCTHFEKVNSNFKDPSLRNSFKKIYEQYVKEENREG